MSEVSAIELSPEAISSEPTLPNLVTIHLRRNVAALLTDFGAFGMGLGFIGYTTVLPRLALVLSNSEPLVGLITTLWAGRGLRPQLPAGRWMAARPRKKPVLMSSAIVGRTLLLVFALLLALNPGVDRSLLFIGLIVAVITFRGTDSIAAVAWFDIMSKVTPPMLRGRILGVGQALGGFLQFAASFIVVWALGATGPGFPHNYAVLFGLACLGFFISYFGLIFLKEPDAEIGDNDSGRMKMAAHITHALQNDRGFQQASTSGVLIGVSTLAGPFYVVHATDYLHIPPASIGLFLAEQTVGGILASVVLGMISERHGSTAVVKLSMLLSLAPPILAVVLHVLGPSNLDLATLGYVVVFAALGAIDSSFLLGFIAYILDIAPPGERTAYMGLSNTIAGLLVIAPTIGGVVLSLTSYPILFVTAGLGPLLGFFVAARLPAI